MKRVALAFAASALAAPASAHGSQSSALPGWTWDPWITLPLLISAVLFAVGFARLHARSGPGRRARNRKAVLFGAGWLVLALALVSPVHEAGERSFAAHMFEHELLMLVAAPLLVLSRPVGAMLWAFPSGGRRAMGALGRQTWFQAFWRALTDPILATLLQAAALWLWHAPALFDLALASDGWHAVQHLAFLITALLFWSAMLHGRQGRGGYGLAAVCLFATSMVSGALGALMAFSKSPWYAPYAAMGLDPFGLSPADDQQLAGLLMWIPGGLVHAGAALVLLGQALRERSPEPDLANP